MKLSKSIAIAALVLAIAVTSPACGYFGSSPTATLKAYFEALQKKDAEGLKKTLSKGTIEMFEKFAQAQNPPKTLDEALKTGLVNGPKLDMTETPETRNEKIDGDKATLEVRDKKTNTWETVLFVKEDGAWKLDFDQMLRNDASNPNRTGNK